MKMLKLTQFKSGINYKYDQKDTLRALGLGKIRRVVFHQDCPQIRGMVYKVRHLVSLEEVERGNE